MDDLTIPAKWEEREWRRNSTLIKGNPGQPLAQPSSVSIEPWLIPGMTTTFWYLLVWPEDSLLSVTRSVLGMVELRVIEVREPLGVWLICPWEEKIAGIGTDTPVKWKRWKLHTPWPGNWEGRLLRWGQASAVRAVRTWKTRQLPRIKVKISSETWNGRQSKIIQIDHWTSSVGNCPKFFNMKEQRGSLSKN